MRADDSRTDVNAPLSQSRSGSERRQRGVPVSIRLLPEERDALTLKAKETGLSLASYLRACALGDPGPRARRSQPVNAALLAEGISALNRVGNNVNQIAKILNAARAASVRDLAETLEVVRHAVGIMVEAAGRKPHP